MITATIFKLPVSSTHSIVGAMMGFGIVAYGAEAIKWKVFAKIGKSFHLVFMTFFVRVRAYFNMNVKRFILCLVSSWVISPLMSGLISSCFYVILQYFVLKKVNKELRNLQSLWKLYLFIFICFRMILIMLR